MMTSEELMEKIIEDARREEGLEQTRTWRIYETIKRIGAEAVEAYVQECLQMARRKTTEAPQGDVEGETPRICATCNFWKGPIGIFPSWCRLDEARHLGGLENPDGRFGCIFWALKSDGASILAQIDATP